MALALRLLLPVLVAVVVATLFVAYATTFNDMDSWTAFNKEVEALSITPILADLSDGLGWKRNVTSSSVIDSSSSAINKKDDGENEEDKEDNVVLDFEVKAPPNKFVNSSVPPFSACLLFKDGNVILPEWLAYHYQTLPLKTVIIGRDPFSMTHPGKIVKEFQDLLGMDITVWEEDDFYFPGRLWYNRKVAKNETSPKLLHAGYLWRQRCFYTKCVQHLRDLKKGWTTIIDTDEFLTFNRIHPEGDKSLIKGRFCQKTFHSLCGDSRAKKQIADGTHIRTKLPYPGASENDTIAEFLMRERINDCETLPRILYGPKEQENDEWRRDVPRGLDVSAFYTERFRYHQNKYAAPVPGKALVHVSQIPNARRVDNPHNIWPKLCGDAFPDYSKALLRVNHYTGTFESFAVHRGTNMTELRALWAHRTENTAHASDDDMKDWLTAFVASVGLGTAKHLTIDLRQWAIENDEHIWKLKGR